jgi:ABC-type Fe3+-siderophore transport system permease subunit
LGLGIVVIAGGTALVVAGAVGFGLMASETSRAAESHGQYILIPISMMLGGGGIVSLGVVAAVHGAEQVPVEPDAASLPTISIGPTGGSLTWRF